MYHLDPQDEWNAIHPDDLWVYNKLILNKRQGHLCGPTGVPVPYSGYYVVRPSINLLGMSRFARIEWIHSSTDRFHPSEFWSEIFEGAHLSVDFRNKIPDLVVVGEKDEEEPLYRWKKWEKINCYVKFPSILDNLKRNYEWINCEFIGNKLIEVHFRRNPDFRYGNSVAFPVWKDEKVDIDDEYRYIEDEDYLRKGFYID